MNDEQRAALVEERIGVVRQIIAGAMKWAAKNPHKAPDSAAFKDVLNQNANDAYRAAVYVDECGCDFCEAARAVPPVDDAERVERAAKAMYFSDANPDPVKHDRVAVWDAEWEKHLAFYRSEGYDPEGFFPVFDLAKKALNAAGAAPSLDIDAMLDSVGANAGVHVWLESEPEPEVGLPHYFMARMDINGPSAGEPSYGTGPTRMAAILSAVELAKSRDKTP